MLGPHLADRGYHVIAMDHIGHGHSSHLPPGCQYSYPQYVYHAKLAMNIFGWPSAHIVGHSMGAMVAFLLCGSFPEMCDKLCMIDGVPYSRPTTKAPDILRKSILDYEKMKDRTALASKSYESLRAAVDARLRAVKNFPGQQYLSEEAAIVLIRR